MRHFALIGRTLSHSHSAEYFNDKFRREGIDAEYSLCEMADIGDLRTFARRLDGFNVTIPYKRDVMHGLDTVDAAAREIGAVNCVKVCRDGSMHGSNTDAAGIVATFAALGIGTGEGFVMPKALVLGSGGAAAAVKYVLKCCGADFLTVSRDGSRGDITYDDLTEEIVAARPLIINATPVGMYPHTDECPALPYRALTPNHILFDLIYNPVQTEFLRRGQAAGARTVNGETMFRRQAEESWRIWNSD